MKVIFGIFALLVSLSASASEPQQPLTGELVFFEGYEGYNKYTSKNVSTQIAPLSAKWLVATADSKTAVCFNGDTISAMAIIYNMVNYADDGTNLDVVSYDVDYDLTSVGEPAYIKDLVLQGTVAGKVWTYTYPKIRPCDRKTKK